MGGGERDGGGVLVRRGDGGYGERGKVWRQGVDAIYSTGGGGVKALDVFPL